MADDSLHSLLGGHLLVGGLLWPLFSLTIAREAANAYHLVFGE